MNGTPRRGPGGFPATPQTNRSQGFRNSGASTPSRPNVRSLPEVPKEEVPGSGPLIPTHVLDPAQQRFYALAFYVGLWAWRSYDFYTLVLDEEESLWRFLKWAFIDMSFLFGLPLMEIPWLEWSNTTAVLLFILHFAIDLILMFRVGIPVQAWAVSLVAFMWDSELAISERSVKPGPILHNASLILGKQIINILPEGSAVLNPNNLTFCLSSSVTHLELPIQIYETDPTEIELVRIDLESGQNETISVKGKNLNSAVKKAKKAQKTTNPPSPLEIMHTVKKPGVYHLRRIVDRSKLEVRPKTNAASAIVVPCPQARVKPTGENRCRNDLSNVALEVEGIPPLRLKYRTNKGGQPREATELQGLMPDNHDAALSRHTPLALIRRDRADVSWAQTQKVIVPLNETLSDSGIWTYAVEGVTDGLGNVVSYVGTDEEDRPKQKPSVAQNFTVHERPTIHLSGCNVNRPLQVAKGDSMLLPVEYSSTGRRPIDSPHTIEYIFTPEANLLPDGAHSPTAELKTWTLRTSREQPLISEAGLYTVKSVSTGVCDGEVLEPASCLLRNPPEPAVSLSSEDIVDKCAGNPIGLRVSLDLTGSPPFFIKYSQQKAGKRGSHVEKKRVDSLRTTFELTPEAAGHYTYTFLSIQDWVYGERPLHGLQLIQDVKPSASAHFVEGNDVKQACIDDTVEFDVGLRGEGPWKLDYELVHNGKRNKRTVEVADEHYTIKTQQLKNGGEYTLSLTSITDKMGCKEPLKAEAKVNVRHERPKAYFGHIDGKQAVMALEGKSVELPLRLTGSGPWRLDYANKDTGSVEKINLNDANSKLRIKLDGTYELLAVSDSVCPGFIDEKASQFSVGWIPRPKITVPESTSMTLEGGKYIREEVCEGDEDSFDVSLSGNAPFDLAYEQQFRDPKTHKPAALKKKDLQALGGTASIRSETSQPGTYTYNFMKLSDSKYDHDARRFTPITVLQTVNPRPSAKFNNPGKTYSYCSREADGEEVIPISLEGVPPFYLEVEIKHYGTPKPELSIHKNIATTKYDLRIEHRKLQLGHSTISIRKIRDARGCTAKPPPGGPRVQISVHDAPTATPLEARTDFCVGDRVSFALGGQVPFTVYYTFEGKERKATNSGTTFRRLAELPGTFTLTGLRDAASECLATLNLTSHIHPIPSVRLSGGQVSEIDIHEGGQSELEFTFQGTPPFEFTYTRSTNAGKGGSGKGGGNGKKSRVLEVRTEISYGMELRVPVQEEGTYEVVSIRDRWCGFARGDVEGLQKGKQGKQKLLKY